ncbi:MULTISPECIES: DUF6596 domain-containing protein [unclassified Pseudonocardia]|uniref:RNA polymerase sigma factor n=1 Tax=unclassified Pseudonocardia TaxID=2619320 RepID=UPI0001FFE5B5|nr:DUF6596 domain-containing protein [Pseudonocardia sp. Ae707_Ps1]OLM18806.1 RNA polymerase sigma-70 factor, ECF subfamily [Pseudonocardia sp. Ae707_Ps1]
MPDAATAVRRAYRESWRVVVAATARSVRDLDLAEDCAQEAFERALRSWPDGVPDNPAGWLTTTARRIALDRLRRETSMRRKLPLLVEPPPGGGSDDDGSDDDGAPTDPLRLVFTCCHPALARESQVALTLRLVCGLDVPSIAAVMLSGEAGVARRITRAKHKIAAARIPFRVPPDDELPARLDTVLTVVHLAYTAGHAGAGERLADTDLTGRATGLARMLVRLLPGEPGPRALLGLVLLTEARGGSRTDDGGDLVLLPDQDRAGWDRRLTAEGLAHTTAALRTGPPHGRFALQAAVAGLHAVAPTWADTDWAQLARTYDALLAVWPSPVVALNRAVVRGRLPDADPAAVLREIDGLAPGLAGYPYLPAARADLLARLGRSGEAAAAYGTALELTTNPTERRFLERRRSALVAASDPEVPEVPEVPGTTG